MKTVYLVTILVKPRKPLLPGSNGDSHPIFRFVAGTNEGRANFLAGICIDRLADYHGLTFDYSVEPLPFAGIGRLPEIEIVRLALESAV